jgi:hypothetical protein
MSVGNSCCAYRTAYRNSLPFEGDVKREHSGSELYDRPRKCHRGRQKRLAIWQGGRFSHRKLIRQEFENLPVKRRHDRIHWPIEDERGEIIKTLEDQQSEEIDKVDHREPVRSQEGNHEIRGRPSKSSAHSRVLNAG